MQKNLPGIDKALNEFHHVIKQLMQTEVFTDEKEALTILKATLKALRDRIGKEEATHLGSQLSPLLRGLYYEGWNLHKDISRSRKVDEFLNDVRSYFMGHDEVDLGKAVPIILGLVLEMIDEGEALQVLRNLPKDVQNMCID